MSTEFIRKMKERYNALLEYFDNPSSAEDTYDDLVILITSLIKKDKNEFTCLLELISFICNNHNRSYNLINKIEQLLTHFKADIQKYYMNSEIFDFFKDNKRILLLLIENEIITIDEYIFSKITSTKYVSMNYLEYFQPEISPFLTTKLINKYKSRNPDLAKTDFIEKIKNQEITDIFYKKRREGENDNYLCRVIRDNAIDDFIIFETQSGLSLNTFIKSSIFETNSFLIGKNITLIEYTVFFGSIQIFNYLYKNGVELSSSLLPYAIHGNNPEIIHLLEEKTAQKIVYETKRKAAPKQRSNPKRKSKRKKKDYSDDDESEDDDSDDEYRADSFTKKKSKSKSKNKSKRKTKYDDDDESDSDDEYRGESRMKSRNSKSKKKINKRI